jgi:hypothetical protein
MLDGPWSGHVLGSVWLVVFNRDHRDNFASIAHRMGDRKVRFAVV